jgi:hypothetical protein
MLQQGIALNVEKKCGHRRLTYYNARNFKLCDTVGRTLGTEKQKSPGIDLFLRFVIGVIIGVELWTHFDSGSIVCGGGPFCGWLSH